MISETRLRTAYFFCLAAILLVFMHLFLPNMGGTMAMPFEYLVWLGIFTIILLAVFQALRAGELVLPTFRLYVFGFAALLLASSVFNPILNPQLFAIEALRFVALIVLWLALHQFPLEGRDRERLLLLIFASGAIEAVIGMLQFHGIPTVIPLLPPTAAQAGSIWGVFQQKNLYASWMALALVVSLHLVTTETFRALRPFARAAFLASVGLMAAGLMLAASRTGLLGFAAGAVVLLAARFSHYRQARRYVLAWGAVLLAGVAYGVAPVGGERTLETYQATMLKDKESSNVRRLLMYETSFEMFKDKPLVGHGFANFAALYAYYQADVIEAQPHYRPVVDSGFTSHPHNEALKILVEGGLMGLAAMLILAWGFARLLWRLPREQAGVGVALLAPIGLHILTEFPLQLSAVHSLGFVLLCYLVTAHFTERKSLPRARVVTAAGMAVAGLLYLGLAGYTLRTFYDYMNYTIFHIKISEKKIVSFANLEPAVDNGYLRNWAEPEYMMSQALAAIPDIAGNGKFIKHYLRWSQQEKRRHPTAVVFNTEVEVWKALWNNDPRPAYRKLALLAVDQGLHLYPNDAALLSHKEELRP